MLQQKNTAMKKTSKKQGAIVSEKVGNYEKHPFFVKNALTARTFLQRVGLPEQLTKKAM